MITALVRLPFARLLRTRRSWVALLGWCALGVGAAFVARRIGYASGADHTLRGTFASLIVPLLSYAVVSAVLGGAGLRPSGRGLVALGARPREVATATLAIALATAAVLCALVGVLVCVVAHGPADVPLAQDLPATALVALGSGATYAAFFGAGSAIGRGTLRAFFLVVDWFLGTPAGLGAVLVPRGHVTSLLGGEPCFALSRTTSSLALVVLLVFYTALAIRLSRR
jgi:hypothetical protein